MRPRPLTSAAAPRSVRPPARIRAVATTYIKGNRGLRGRLSVMCVPSRCAKHSKRDRGSNVPMRQVDGARGLGSNIRAQEARRCLTQRAARRMEGTPSSMSPCRSVNGGSFASKARAGSRSAVEPVWLVAVEPASRARGATRDASSFASIRRTHGDTDHAPWRFSGLGLVRGIPAPCVAARAAQIMRHRLRMR
jgi:hypothetical protein